MKDLFDLSGKIAVVTGGNQVIGFGIARGLASAEATPRGRVAYPDDYAGAAIFLASEASDYITGYILLVDGDMAIC